MRLSFVLALLALFSVQVLSLTFEKVPEKFSRLLLQETPMLNPAARFEPLFLAAIGVLVVLLLLGRLRRDATPLAAGSFLNGMGHAGLQVVALEWLKPYFADAGMACVAAFAAMAVFGSWRAVRRKNEDDSMALISYFISVIAAIIFGYFVVSHFGELNLSLPGVLVAGCFLSALPAYFSARACALQVALIQPGGGKAVLKILGLNCLGAVCGAVGVAAVMASAGSVYATVVVGGVYLVAAWVFTQGRGSPFAGIMVPSA